MLTNQSSEISLTRAEKTAIPDTVKRTRVDSPLKAREESQKKSKNQHNQMLMIEDQRSSEVNLLAMIEVLETRMLNSENRLTEQANTITVLKAQVASTQKKLDLALKSINTAPLACQPIQNKEKVVSPVEQTLSNMTVVEVQLKEKEGYDYGLMKGNEGWTT